MTGKVLNYPLSNVKTAHITLNNLDGWIMLKAFQVSEALLQPERRLPPPKWILLETIVL